MERVRHDRTFLLENQKAETLGIDHRIFDQYDPAHPPCRAGAVPKDGPSAGITC